MLGGCGARSHQRSHRLFDAIDQRGLAENTLIVVISDNGPYLGVGDVRPLREGKGFLYEGGIRVPMIVRWTGTARSGVVARCGLTACRWATVRRPPRSRSAR